MPDSNPQDRDVTFQLRNSGDKGHPYELRLKSHDTGYLMHMTAIEARETMMQIADQLGYTYEKHKSTAEKVEEAVKAGVQTALSGAAVATLSDMGYSWQGGARWKPPIGKAPDFDLTDSLKAQLEVAQNGARHAEHFKKQMKFHSDQRVNGIEFLDTVQEALGLEPGGDQTAIVPAIKALRTRITFLTMQAEAQDRALQQAQRDARAYGSTIVAVRKALDIVDLAVPDEVIVEVIKTRKQVQENCQYGRQRLATTLDMEHCGIPPTFDAVIGAIEALQAACVSRGKEIDDAWGALAKRGYGTTSTDTLPTRIDFALNHASTATSVADGTRISIEGLMHDINSAFTALKDHGYAPYFGETLGTLIRDAFGTEAAKLRHAQAQNDLSGAWHRGHVIGYTSGKDSERARCAVIAQSAADRLDSAVALRIAQEIENPA